MGYVMQLHTKLFGDIGYETDSVITLNDGLIGIADKKHFLLIEKEAFQPFSYLQCIDDPGLALVVINPFLVESSYNFALHEEDLRSMGIKNPDDFLMLAVVVFAARLEDVTVNLKAPLLINIHTKQGRQVILLNDDYSVSEPLLKPSTLRMRPDAVKEP
jgi:flagellar assembly factor FliW